MRINVTILTDNGTIYSPTFAFMSEMPATGLFLSDWCGTIRIELESIALGVLLSRDGDAVKISPYIRGYKNNNPVLLGYFKEEFYDIDSAFNYISEYAKESETDYIEALLKCILAFAGDFLSKGLINQLSINGGEFNIKLDGNTMDMKPFSITGVPKIEYVNEEGEPIRKSISLININDISDAIIISDDDYDKTSKRLPKEKEELQKQKVPEQEQARKQREEQNAKEKETFDSVSKKIEAFNKWKTDSKNLEENKEKKANEKLQALFDDTAASLITERNKKIEAVNEKIRTNEAQRRDKELICINKGVSKKEKEKLNQEIPELKEAVSLLEKEKTDILSSTAAEAKKKIDSLGDEVKKISEEIEAEFKPLPEPELPTYEEFRIYTERLPYENPEKKKTKTELQNEQIMEDILDGMAIGEEYTVPELIECNYKIDMYTNQKISALVARLVKKGQVKRRTEGGKTYFSLVEGCSDSSSFEKTFEKPEIKSIYVSTIWDNIAEEGLKKISDNSIDDFDRNRKKTEEEHQKKINEIKTRLKKQRNTSKALIILGCVAAVIVAIICIVNYTNGAPEREITEKINSGTYTSEWAKSNEYDYKVCFNNSIIQTAADKLTELHQKDKPKEALTLASELMGTGLEIGGDSYLHPTDEFIDWLKDSIRKESADNTDSDDSSWESHTAYGFQIRWNNAAASNQISIIGREGEDYFTEQDFSTYYYNVSSGSLININ